MPKVKKKMPKISNPKNIFNSNLFWDAEDIDIEQHAAYIISRVLDYGNEKDLKILRKIYSDEKLIEVIRKRRGIMPRTAKFWSVYFRIPVREIECLKKNFYDSVNQRGSQRPFKVTICDLKKRATFQIFALCFHEKWRGDAIKHFEQLFTSNIQ